MTERPINVFMVRHGEAAALWGEDIDPGLSALGQKQAAEASAVLLERLDTNVQLISSPLLRAQQTALPLAKAMGVDVKLDPVFREIPSPGDLHDRTAWLSQFMQQTWDAQPPLLHDWRAQAVNQLLTVERDTVVFTHFMILNAVVGFVSARTETVHFLPDNGSITHLRLLDKSPELIQLGKQMRTVVN